MNIICLGCGNTETWEELKDRKPNCISCCPDRHMVDVKEAVYQLEQIASKGDEYDYPSDLIAIAKKGLKRVAQ